MKIFQSPCVIAFAIAISSSFILPAADARMYQWEQAQSGRIQLSGHAPAWYRGTQPGPRILVFDNGKLVDDTAIQVGELQRQYLRQQALGEQSLVGQDIVPEVSKEESLQSALTEAAKAGIDIEELAATAKEQASEEDGSLLNGDLTAKVDELKDLLSRWDSAKADEARALLDNGANRSAPPAPPQ
ncbi:MAG: hypothetical protein AAF387_12435 [Pseudomonadota bacterium]